MTFTNFVEGGEILFGEFGEGREEAVYCSVQSRGSVRAGSGESRFVLSGPLGLEELSVRLGHGRVGKERP